MNPKNLPDVCVIAALRGAIGHTCKHAPVLDKRCIKHPFLASVKKAIDGRYSSAALTSPLVTVERQSTV